MKRWLTMLLTIALLLSLAPMALAAGTTITVSKKEVTSGTGTSDVNITLTLSGNTGLAGCQLEMDYAEGLTLKKIVKGTALSGLSYTEPGNLAENPISLVWDGQDSDSSNGVMLTLTFSVPRTQAKTYPLTLQAVRIYDQNLNEVDVTLVPGEINVACKNHTWDAGKVTTDPTCTAAGVKTYTCTVCGATKTETIKALGHSFTSYVSDNNATCAKDGTKTAVCDHGCGEKKTVTDTGSKTNEHTPDGNTDCSKATKCTVCGKILKAAETHIWDEDHPNVTKKATCTEAGTAVYTCTVDGATEEREIPALGHDLVYTAEGAVLTETCSRCDHTATATVTAENAAYTGAEVKTGKGEPTEGWLGGDVTVTYADNINAGTAKATIAKGEATATAEFVIEKATEYTLTLDKLSQTVGSVTGAAYKLTPADETAAVSVEYCTVTPESPCGHVHDDTCNYNAETDTCDHQHDDACGYAEQTETWSETCPTEAGTYAVRAKLISSDNIVVPDTADYVTGELKIQRRTSGGGGGSSSGGSTATDSGKTDSTDSGKTDNTDSADKDNQDGKDPTPTTPKFTDVAENSWYKEATDYVTEKGLMGGTGSGTFAPEGAMTRAMVMTVLARHAGEDTEGGATWYEKGMNWAKEHGVSDGTNPNGDVTREQLVVMLYRYVNSPAAEGELTFSDASTVSPWAEAAMKWAVAKGILGVMGDGTLNPQGNATRAQVATILMRFVELEK